ncbi:tyrosine-type recombinase/integrase [Anaerovibrio lipolyticus]|uniref:tyrosine-type recombinase/integrase n=1 Tax=Anaerovibrio lipolyticus TaxID=82374 RepID=UPI0023F39025|nr:tyrosine-type recombinase/integrase [Anaerovibrio lipolyticus]
MAKAKARADHEGSVFFMKSCGLWAASISLGYNGKTGRRKKLVRYAKTQKDALKKLKELQEMYAHNIHYDANTITVEKWFTQWFEIYKVPKLRANTQVSYKRVMAYCTDNIGKMKLEKVRASDLQNIIYNVIGKDHYRTCQFFRTVVKQIFARAVRDHLIVESPAEYLELPPKPPKKEFVKPTTETWQALLDADVSFYGWTMIILTVLATGMRRSEILALTWDSFNIERENGVITGGTVTIDKAMGIGDVDPVTKRRVVYVDKTKSLSSIRTLQLHAEYFRELINYKKIQNEMRLRSRTWEHPEMVFTTNDGRYYNPDVFSSLYSKVCREHDIKTTFHMLRHDFATSMKTTHDFDVKDIQHQLGHSNIQITLDTYTHIEEVEQQKIANFVGDRLAKVVNGGQK